MGLFRKIIIGLAACGGLATASQAPEFSQQYRQRLGGAIEELRTVAKDFENDAAASELTSNEALAVLSGSDTKLNRDRGTSMTRTIRRFETLRGQRQAMERIPVILRPMSVLSNPDAKISKDAWNDFEPAIPINLPGLTWAALGALLAGFAAALITRPFRRKEKIDGGIPSKLKAPPIRVEPRP